MIEESFKNSKANDEGLSEMKICRCDPTLCVYHNGLKGPLMRESDVYETDGDDIAVDPNNPNGPPILSEEPPGTTAAGNPIQAAVSNAEAGHDDSAAAAAAGGSQAAGDTEAMRREL